MERPSHDTGTYLYQNTHTLWGGGTSDIYRNGSGSDERQALRQCGKGARGLGEVGKEGLYTTAESETPSGLYRVK